MLLKRELEVYKLHLMDLLGVNAVNEGKYTVIRGDTIKGPFDTYEAALEFGYREHGLAPFLAKKIEVNETVMYFSRDLR